jgi:hypothetical protein
VLKTKGNERIPTPIIVFISIVTERRTSFIKIMILALTGEKAFDYMRILFYAFSSPLSS